jgi:hypothetical protein
MWDLWWTKWHWDRFLVRVLKFFPCRYNSTVALCTHTSPGGWTICPLMAAVQRHGLTPSTGTIWSHKILFSGFFGFFVSYQKLDIFTECDVTANYDMNSARGNVRVKETAAADTNMLLRDRIKRLMGNGVHASWRSLPEVRSSGLLRKFTASHWRCLSSGMLHWV